MDHVIVAGGTLDDSTDHDDIEILNWRTSSHWVIARIKLPEPMWAASLTVSNDLLYIVGYARISVNITSATYRVSVDTITSSAAKLTSNQIQWSELSSAPYGDTAIIPNSVHM